MVTTKRPKSITITIRDRDTNKSKSITVYDTNLDEVEEIVKKALQK